MELEIYNFRNITYKKFIFDNGIHLFEGESGIGKSTCLEAIQWTLYGGKNCYPFGFDRTKKEVTKISLTINEMKITRSKPPDTVYLKLEDGKELKFDEAQKYIDHHFGSKLFWESSYYLKQDHRNLLLFGSKEEKNNIVKEIVFGSDTSGNTPDKYLEKVDSLIKNIDTDIDVKQKIVNYLLQSIKDDFIEIPNKDIKRMKKLYPKKQEIEDKLENIKLKIMEQSENKKRKLRKIQINMELKDYPMLSLDFMEKWRNWLNYSYELNKLILQGVTTTSVNTDLDILKRQIYQLEKDKEIYFPNKELLEKIKKKFKGRDEKIGFDILTLDYDKEQVDQTISQLEERKIQLIKYNGYLEKKKSLTKIVDKIKENKKKITDFYSPLSEIGNINNLDDIKEKLMEMKTDLLKCPKCNKKLVLSEGKLKEGKGTHVTKQKLKEYTNEYKRLQEYHNWVTESEYLQKVFSGMKLPILFDVVQGDENEIDTLIKLLRNINIVNFDSQEYENKKNLLENELNQKKAQEYQVKIRENYISGIENIPVPENMNQYYRNYQSLLEELKLIDAQLFEEDTELEEKKLKAEEYLKDIEKYQDYLKFDREVKKSEKENQELRNLLQKKESCLKLKKIIQEESNLTFENLMISFNQILNDIVSEIFEDIYIEIGMFKKLKSKSEIKPQFNMNVTLKGHVYDNLSFLSGGEKDRMSIALMVTLAKLGRGNIVMLDETMSSLGEDMRHQMLELIKKHLPDKIVLVVCHSTIKGYYDSVISF